MFGMMKITHGSLFSGIGGFDLASEWMGWDNLFHCEWNEFGQKVLKHYWPSAESFNDITKTDFTKYANKIDILTGGFPCQPYSTAGKRLGKEDDRHLWPEMLRVIREVRPRWVVGENVRGLVNWSGGLVFDEVQADLEAQGYEVQPFILPACAVNAPHRRERVWFIANSKHDRESRIAREYEAEGRGEGLQERNEVQQSKESINLRPEMEQNASDTNGARWKEQHPSKEPSEKKQFAWAAMYTDSTSKQGEHIGQTREGKFNGSDSRIGINNFQKFPTQSPICGGDDGLPTELDGITFPKWRNESIKAYGNAIVPQVAYEIFKAINEMDKKFFPKT
jgi:DNA (cytosine-5)-methyltransferase 1